MNREQFEAWFKNTGNPWLSRFQQSVTDVMSNRLLFWFAAVMVMVGVVTVVRFFL